MQVEGSGLPVTEEGGGCGEGSSAPFLTVEELVARWFIEGSTANVEKTNRDNVRELISSGVLPGRKIGRRWYVHLSAVEAFEAGRDDPAVMRHTDSRRFAGAPHGATSAAGGRVA